MLVWERRLAVVALATVVVAWIVGLLRYDTDVGPFLSQALRRANKFEECRGGIFAGIETDGNEQRIVGYVAIGESDGYGGPMRTGVIRPATKTHFLATSSFEMVPNRSTKTGPSSSGAGG